ncbi:hypothetical protein [Diaphorobacter ruginosibacter]|uniref:hypothetical protein n=1 Tax=Diaphorobacter ruginosibacter TaxID=1715720 RepID=UPI003342A8B3
MKPVFSLLIILIWVFFVAETGKKPIEYFEEKSTVLMPNEIVDWMNKDRKLYMAGFSRAEPNFRWSKDEEQHICFKPVENIHQKNNVKISMSILMPNISIGKDFYVGEKGKLEQRACSSVACSVEFDVPVSGSDGRILCAYINAPSILKVNGDYRNLGYKLISFKYSIE